MAISTYSNGIGSYASAVVRYAPYGILESPDFVNTSMILTPTVYDDLVAAGKDVEEVYSSDISWDGGLLGSGYRIQERSMMPAGASTPFLSQCRVQYGTDSAALVPNKTIKNDGDQNPKFADPSASNYPNTLIPLTFPWTTVDLFGDGDQWVVGGIEIELEVDLSYLIKNTPQVQWRSFDQDFDQPVSAIQVRQVTFGQSTATTPRALSDYIASVQQEYNYSLDPSDPNHLTDFFPLMFYI
jgi:hypothetical protein